jgi:hypothetical protein
LLLAWAACISIPAASAHANQDTLAVTIFGADEEALGAADPDRLLEVVRGPEFDRVEVYSDGELEQIIAIVRNPGSALASLLEAPGAGEDDGSSSPGRMSLDEALRVAADRSESASRRAEAIRVLGASGSAGAVDVLREVALQEDGGLEDAAIQALGGFAGTAAESSAQAALIEAHDLGIGDPVQRFEALAQYDVTPLITAYRELDNSLQREYLVRAASRATSGDLTGLFLEALQDGQSHVRTAAANSLARGVGLPLDSDLITKALEIVAATDASSHVQRVAQTALLVRSRGGFAPDVPAPPVDLDLLSPHVKQSLGIVPGREDPNPAVPGRRDDDPVIPGSSP